MNARQDLVSLIVSAVAERHVMHVVPSREAGISLARASKGYPVIVIARFRLSLLPFLG